jgi:hypothetical protein
MEPPGVTHRFCARSAVSRLVIFASETVRTTANSHSSELFYWPAADAARRTTMKSLSGFKQYRAQVLHNM